MKSGAHQQTLVDALEDADQVLLLRPQNIDWNIDALFDSTHSVTLFDSVDGIINQISQIDQGHLVVMSNGGFDDIFNKIIPTL
ncbi:UDP-N-acetylmuramate:L-alanyl-gamma-D-glutamyl-meso-diaminopimelate ligase [hydrothermal vent metagenome]|uniref:UDP-N-acetylmuramate:L-alanyl-gamma-D-glutamyl-meso-diaminopimelate ligase n=1 Tax=hydrothermal vent metagenome TaxID=652676 RepID=A0A1W1DVR2_9ZZZZ